MQATWLDNLNWFADAAMALIALAALLSRKLGKEWRFVALFLVVRILSEISQAVAIHCAYKVYFYTFWISQGIQYICQFGVLYDVFNSVFSSIPKIPRNFPSLLIIFITLAAAGSSLASAFSHASFKSALVAGLVGMQRTALMSWCAAFIACSIVTSWQGLGWKRNSLVFATGSVIMNGSGMLASLLMKAVGPKHSTLIDNIAVPLDVLALLVWSVFLRAEKASPHLLQFPSDDALSRLEEYAQTNLGIETS